MSKIADKVKEKLKGAKDKVASTTKESASTTKEKMSSTKDKVASTTKESVGRGSSSSTSGEQGRKYEEGAAGTTSKRTKDPAKEYDEKEPMSPAKIKQHEPTAVRRDPSEVNIVEPGKQSTSSSQDAAEKARRSGMTKGTAGAADMGSEYEQGAAGSNK
jgi:hypothetical protein